MARWNSQSTHTDISDFSDNPEVRKNLLLWRLKIAAFSLIVAAIVGFSAKPAYRAFRDYRIGQNLDAAKAAERLQDWSVARDKARSVLIVRRQDFEATRIWTRALAMMGEPRAYMAAAQLFTDPRATQADQLESLQVMGAQAPQAVALGAYASLPKKLRGLASFRAAITPLLIRRGEIDIAEKGLREVMQPSDEPKVRLELLRALCARPEPKRVAEARKIFSVMVARNADDEALEALLILGETPGGLVAEDTQLDLPRWLKVQPKATALHHLVGMHPALEATPDTADQLYEIAVGRFLTTEPGVLGTWLVRHGKAEMAARVLAEPAITRSDAYIARLHALLRLNKNAEIEKALAAPPAPVDLVEMEIVRAAMTWRRGDASASGAAWTRALNEASFDANRNRFIEIARTAQGFGAAAAATDAWVAAVSSGWGQLPLYRDLQPVFGSLASEGRSEDLLAMFRTLLRFEPSNPDLLNNFYYLGLLHGILTPAQVSAAMMKLVEQQPNRAEFNSALVLAEMMDGNAKAALETLPKLAETKLVSVMMKTALEGSARLLAGETAAGTAMLKEVNWQLFMRQERVVFRDLLIKLKISDLPLPELESPAVDTDPAKTPAWRKAVEQRAKDRANDVLPALPAPRLPGEETPAKIQTKPE